LIALTTLAEKKVLLSAHISFFNVNQTLTARAAGTSFAKCVAVVMLCHSDA